MQLTKIKKDGKTSFNIQASAAEVMALEAVLVFTAFRGDSEGIVLAGIGLADSVTLEQVNKIVSDAEKKTSYNLELVRQFRCLMINEPIPELTEYLSAGVKS